MLRDGGTLITALPLLLSVRACMRVRVCVSPSTPAHELAPVQGQEVNILAGGPERSAAGYHISSVGERGCEGVVFFVRVGAHRTSEALASVSSFDIRGTFIGISHPLSDPVSNADLELKCKSRGASSMVR